MSSSTYDRNRRRKKKRRFGVFEIIVAVIAIITIACAHAGGIDPRNFFPAPFMVLAFIPMVLLCLAPLVVGFDHLGVIVGIIIDDQDFCADEHK